jgi:hypothetical protein
MTKRCLMTVCFALLAVSAGLAQEKAPKPPSSETNGPSLEVTMKFIQDKLKAKLPAFWDDITADPANCQLTFARSGKWAGTDWEDETLTFSFREVEKIELRPSEDPPGFTLIVWTTTEKSVHKRHFKNGKPRPKADSDSGEWRAERTFDEDLANRLAKAMIHAVELCGGGSKPEPF